MTGRTAQQSEAGRLYDEWLVTLAMSGDRKARDRLAGRWQPRLARAARRMLRNDEQALVAVQEAWVSILRGMGSLQEPARFAPWAFGILRRRCVDQIRLEAGRRSRETAEVEDAASLPTAEGSIAIDQAFAALSPDQRLAAQLHFVEGFTLAEIAGVQDVPLGTAKTRLFHARRKLKAALEGDDT